MARTLKPGDTIVAKVYIPPPLTDEEIAFIRRHPHRDPEFSLGGKLKPGIVKTEHMHVAVRTASVHKTIPYWKVHHAPDMEHVDGYDWEIFGVSHTGYLDGQLYIWGMFVLGIGAFNQMVPIEHVRDLLPSEREAWSKKVLGMVGSHSGNLSYTLPSGVKA